jgi:uracil-xanthine permease
MNEVTVEQGGIAYPLDSKPPTPKALVLATQHVLTMFGATVSVPLLFGPEMEMDPASVGLLVSSVMICSGVATFLQVRFGSRLPIIQGVSFSFLAAFFACIAYAKENPVEGVEPGVLSMQYIAGSIMVGSVVEMILGFTGLVGKLHRVVTPVVIGPVIMLIGLALYGHGAPKAGMDWKIGGLTIFLVALFTLFLSQKNRIFRVFPVLLAVLISWALCLALSQGGVFEDGDASYVSFAGLSEVPWFRYNLAWGENPVLMPWGAPRFEAGLIVAALAGFLASMVESVGDYHGCAAMAGADEPDADQLSKGIGMEGAGCFGTSLLGGFSSTSYSENIALVGLTGVASRYVVTLSAFVLIALGFMAKFGAIVATVPGPIVGGLYCSLFGLIAAVGIQQLAKADLTSQRTLFIAGFSLFMGLSVPAYFGTNAYVDGKAAVEAALPEGAASVLVSLGSTGMGVAAIIGLLLDNIVPGTDAERGIAPKEA